MGLKVNEQMKEKGLFAIFDLKRSYLGKISSDYYTCKSSFYMKIQEDFYGILDVSRSKDQKGFIQYHMHQWTGKRWDWIVTRNMQNGEDFRDDFLEIGCHNFEDEWVHKNNPLRFTIEYISSNGNLYTSEAFYDNKTKDFSYDD